MTAESDDVAALFDEFKAIRWGCGVNRVDLIDRVGPVFRKIAGVTEGEAPGSARKKIIDGLDQLTRRLDYCLRRIARAAFGLECRSELGYLDRLDMLERDLHRVTRTLQRHCDKAFRRLAEIAVEDGIPVRGSQYGAPWRTSALRVTLSLSGRGADVVEFRTIEGNQDAMAEIEHSLTVPPPHRRGRLDPATLDLRADSGAEVTRVRAVSASRVVFGLRLAKALAPGDLHEFGIRLHLVEIAPFYFCTPIHPCDLFELEVRFGSARPASPVRVVDGAMAHEATDPVAASEMMGADRFGAVRHEFHDLRPGNSYGLAWAVPDRYHRAA